LVQELQTALHAKAKENPSFRFYALYDKLYRNDILRHAYRCCRAKKGAAGVDGMRFEDIEVAGVDSWLGELTQSLKDRTYRTQAVRRVYIPKPDGKQRPLGVPTIRDRVVQTAVVLILGPIFEADLPSEQHAYRANRDAHSAIKQVHGLLYEGHTEIVDADLSGYFDTIPHAELMRSVTRRVVDRHVLHLIQMWLDAPIEEISEKGGKTHTTRNRDEGRGIPQGSPLSPLLSNLYMRRFLLGWKTRGLQTRLKARIVNYADDLVICCKGSGAEALKAMREMMNELKLTVNEDKTRLCQMPTDTFDFLGYTFGRFYSAKTGAAYFGSRPSKKSIKRVVQAVTEKTARNTTLIDAVDMVENLNALLRGWANYFCLGPVGNAYRAIDTHTKRRLRRWLCMKHKGHRTAWSRYPDRVLYERYGLFCMPHFTRGFPWAKA
jgi:group II intron reverse transcriptase/maturase